MTRTQIQFPDPLYRRLKEIAEQNDWSLAEVMRKAAEHFVSRFPEPAKLSNSWHFPILDCGGDYLVDPADLRAEADAMLQRSAS
ncbi:MAG: CopG family transcriptional regulator [Verrucomicrobiales bacterium]